MKGFSKILKWILIALFWIGVWALAAYLIGKPLLLPSPLSVLRRLGALIQTEQFYLVTGISLWNILSGILLAIVGGTVLAFITSKISFLRALILPIMTVIKATPVASFIILALIWIGSARVPTFITILIVLPLIWTNLDVGFSKTDPELLEVAGVYRVPFGKKLRFFILPSVKPYFVSACRASVGLAWKAGIAAEILAMPRHTIGSMIGDAKQYMETTDMFAWTLSVIVLSLIIELLFSVLFQRTAKESKKEGSVC